MKFRRRRRFSKRRTRSVRRRPLARSFKRGRRSFKKKRFGRRSRSRKGGLRKKYVRSMASQFRQTPIDNLMFNYGAQMTITTTSRQKAFWDHVIMADDADYSSLHAVYTTCYDFYVKRIVGVYELMNQDVKPTRVSCYFWKCNNDIPLAFVTLTGCVNSGFVDQQNGNSANLENPNATPFQSQRFGHFFKVYKVKHLMLMPGLVQTLRLSVKYVHLNRSVDGGASTSLLLAARGKTKGIGFIVHGTPVNDSVTTTNVGTGLAKINLVATERFQFCRPVNLGPTWSSTNSLSNISSEQFMNYATDIKVATDIQA